MGKNIKTLRRFLALVMAFGVVAGLCACTQQSSSSAPPSATSSESQTPDAVVAEWPDFLTVGGGSTGGVFFSAAAGIAQLLSSETDTTAICNGGVNTGLKVAALGEQWFTAPAPMLTGSYLSPQWSEKDASPYCGDSTITEVVGMGAFAGAAAPSVLRLRGGTYQDGINQSMDMRTLTVGLNSNYPIPLLDFTGPGLAIDIRKVINTGTPVVCHGGIISKDGGQIGAGIATFPMEV